MGTGKTTFVSALAQVLGAQDVASSPTFALCQEYPLEERAGSTEKQTIRHLDLYRIQHDSELRGLGWDELMEDAGAITLVEWPERGIGYLPEATHIITLDIDKTSSEDLSASANCVFSLCKRSASVTGVSRRYCNRPMAS